MNGPGPAFCVQMAARVVNENPAHHLSRDGKKMCAAVPLDASLIDKPQECLIYQRRGLQSVAPVLAVHIAMSQPVQLAVNDRHHALKRRLVAPAPVQKHLSDGQLCLVVHPRCVGALAYGLKLEVEKASTSVAENSFKGIRQFSINSRDSR